MAAAPGQHADADEGSGEGDLVDIDVHPEIDPDGAEVEVPVSATKRLKKSAASLSYLLTLLRALFARCVTGQRPCGANNGKRNTKG
eukprot:4964920-Pyramimonas_sp.AAC.1